MKKLVRIFLLVNILLAATQLYAADDLVLSTFETGATGEQGLNLSLATAGSGYNAAHFSLAPALLSNDSIMGTNLSGRCIKMKVKTTGRRWGTFVYLDIPNGGITPAMMAQRKYLKVMVLREYAPNNLRITLKDNNYWNNSSDIYVGKPTPGKWVDLVIDLSKTLTKTGTYAGPCRWSDSTITKICLQPIENATANWSATTATGAAATEMKVMFDNFVLSDNSLPRAAPTVTENLEIKEIYSRLFADYFETSVSDTIYYKSQLPDGSWTDIDYASRSKNYWPVMNHLYRLHAMSKLFNEQTDKQSALSLKLIEGIKSGIAFWQTQRPVSDNWFYNDIAKQLEYMPILVLMRDYLPEATITDICKYFVIAPANNTGANLVEMASSVFVRGVMQNNPQLITEAINNIKTLIVPVAKGKDGIQVDNSFIFHGLQLFSTSYNLGIMSKAAMWIKMTKGLSFAFADSYTEGLRNVMLDGNRWFYYKNVADYNTIGRSISRINGTITYIKAKEVHDVSPALERMISIDTPYAPEYNYMIDVMKLSKPDTLVGNRHFYRADCMVQRRPGYYISIKMCSSRTSGTESGNSENLKGFWMPFGAHCVMTNGGEFKNTFPLWDWTKIPGVTCPEELPAFSWTLNQPTTFVGGVSNGRSGVSTLQLNKQSTTARKSWFMFDNETVALGAGITSTNVNTVNTTLAQNKLKGKVLINGIAAQPNTKMNFEGVKSVYHDSVCYVFPTSTKISLTNTAVSGNWNSINLSQPDSVLTDSVFNLWVSHGIAPVDSSYSYVIAPNMLPENVASYSNQLPLNILSNTANVQAVTQTTQKLTGAVFHAAGELVIDANLKINVYQPCALLIDQSVNPIKVTASDPGQSSATVKVDLIYKNNPVETLNITLPTGNYTGASTTVNAVTMMSTSINNVLKNNGLSVYPNPISGNTLRLKIDTDYFVDDSTLAIMSVDGRKVFEISDTTISNNFTIKLPDSIKKGMYILSLKNNKTQHSESLIFQKI